MYEVRRYRTAGGKDPFALWMKKLRDTKARIAIDRRLNRMAAGNFGDHKFCMQGVWEIRLQLGPGYRVYYAVEEEQIILLLGAGDKSSQADDIQRATEALQDWKEREDER